MGAYRDPNEPHIEKLMANLKNIAPEKREEIIAHAMLRLKDLPFGEAAGEPILPDKQIFHRMLFACEFDWVNKSVTEENFPVAEAPDEDTEYELVCLNRMASTKEAEAEIKNRGLEPATLADLLLYVRKNPDEQKRYPIVALGSRWQDSDGCWWSPYADYWRGGRYLGLNWREHDWRGRCGFLARKR
ncbi:hypothetical protein L6259_00310 [Candidatus Parcubacteria bacterium]|nr:hypothetical protein [Candidatus Parcubacteria bacterium]